MNSRLSGTWQMTKIHLADIRRGRWFIITTGLYLLLLGIFILVGFKESNILGFTGLSRVLINFSHALVIVLPLLALTMTVQAIPSDRENGTLEALMSHPIRRSDYFGGLVVSRLIALLAPFVIVLLGLGALSQFGLGEELPWDYLGMTLAGATALVFASVGLGTLISAASKNTTRALIYGLLIWVCGIALLDFALIGMMLQWDLKTGAVFTLASVNPVQTVRFVLLTSVETELNILGPVGYFMVNKVGPGWIKILGTLWPLAFGSLSLWFAWGSLKRSDIV